MLKQKQQEHQQHRNIHLNITSISDIRIAWPGTPGLNRAFRTLGSKLHLSINTHNYPNLGPWCFPSYLSS